MDDYSEFIASKRRIVKDSGMDWTPHPGLFPFQRDCVKWATKKGRAALFEDTGLGKSRQEADWARAISQEGRVLVLCPLAVAEQWVREARHVDVDAKYLREDDPSIRVAVTNYDMIDHFDLSKFTGVCLDESSILKAYNGATRTKIIQASQVVPYRLAATATPAPNDYTELGNHAEFLGICSRAEMLAEFFVHDGGDTSVWRLKGHAIRPFWEFVCSWAAIIRMPSDLGYPDDGYLLPPVRWHEHVVEVDHTAYHSEGLLFAPTAMGLSDQRATRRATVDRRIEVAAELAQGTEPVLIWGELNRETDSCEDAIPGSVQVQGSDESDDKARNLLDFADGKIRVLVTKPKIAGFGLNWQHCNRIIFLGASHSYEQTYQAIRRCWRFGQRRPVDVHVIRAANEASVVQNYKRKERDALNMWDMTRPLVVDMIRSISSSTRQVRAYNPTQTMEIPPWLKLS